MQEGFAAQDVLPTGVRRRRGITSVVLPAVLLGELMAGVALGAAWELTSTSGRSANVVTAEPVTAEPVTSEPVAVQVPVLPVPHAAVSPAQVPVAEPAPVLSPAATATVRPVPSPPAEPPATRNPFAPTG